MSVSVTNAEKVMSLRRSIVRLRRLEMTDQLGMDLAVLELILEEAGGERRQGVKSTVHDFKFTGEGHAPG